MEKQTRNNKYLNTSKVSVVSLLFHKLLWQHLATVFEKWGNSFCSAVPVDWFIALRTRLLLECHLAN